MMGWYDGGVGWGGPILMTLMMVTFWALLILGGVAIYRSTRRDDNRSPRGRADAERLLDERFARGEGTRRSTGPGVSCFTPDAEPDSMKVL